MLNSKELRVKAWESLKNKYRSAFFAAFLTGIIYSLGKSLSELYKYCDKKLGIDAVRKIGPFSIDLFDIGIYFVSALILIFIGNIVLVGCNSFFIKNTDSKPPVSTIFSGYKSGYGRNVKAMLLIDIKLCLWALLLVVPAIVKAFEYSIIPYIIADNPEISTKDAFDMAKQMMKGNKWRLFKLNLSFIGWELLCTLTLGIGVLFLVPYIDAANAEFYVELKKQ